MAKGKGRTTTTVSLKANAEYKRALNALASLSDKEIGELVYEAIQATFGEKISAIIGTTKMGSIPNDSIATT